MGFRYGEAEALKQYFLFSMHAVFQNSLDEAQANAASKRADGNKSSYNKPAPKQQPQQEKVDEDVVW